MGGILTNQDYPSRSIPKFRRIKWKQRIPWSTTNRKQEYRYYWMHLAEMGPNVHLRMVILGLKEQFGNFCDDGDFIIRVLRGCFIASSTPSLSRWMLALNARCCGSFCRIVNRFYIGSIFFSFLLFVTVQIIHVKLKINK